MKHQLNVLCLKGTSNRIFSSFLMVLRVSMCAAPLSASNQLQQ